MDRSSNTSGPYNFSFPSMGEGGRGKILPAEVFPISLIRLWEGYKEKNMSSVGLPPLFSEWGGGGGGVKIL